MTLFALALACMPDPAAEAPPAAVHAPSAAAPAPAPAGAPAVAVPAGAISLDAAASKISARGAKVTKFHDLSFTGMSGWMRLDGESLAEVAITVAIDSLVADPEKLRLHLLGPDFFDVPIHPAATFRSTSITGSGPVQVAGDMTIRGTTRGLSFPAEIATGAAEVRAHATFSIDRKDFGVVYPGKPDDLIADAVALTVDLVAKR